MPGRSSLVLTSGRVGETYNIGGRSERTNLQVVKAICALVDELRPRPDRPRARSDQLRAPTGRATTGATPSIRPRSSASSAGAAGDVRDRPAQDRALVPRQPAWWQPLRDGVYRRRAAGTAGCADARVNFRRRRARPGGAGAGRRLRAARPTSSACRPREPADVTDRGARWSAPCRDPSRVWSSTPRPTRRSTRPRTSPRPAQRVNRDGAGKLGAAAARGRCPLIHVSTDYVFDGRKTAPYVRERPGRAARRLWRHQAGRRARRSVAPAAHP